MQALRLICVVFQFDVIEQDAVEILSLIRSWRNRSAPISRIPPEILALVPDFWGKFERNKSIIALTHVCRAWRELFVSQSSFWTDLDCVGTDKTRVYLQRSKSSPINLILYRNQEVDLPPRDPFFQITPHAIGRLKSLFIHVASWDLENVTNHLSHPAPLLEDMRIDSNGYPGTEDNPVLEPTLFNGDLSSLRELCLGSVDTELPWRNMANLTSLMLTHTSISVRQFLDFFESAPRLYEVGLYSATPTSGAEGDRLVSLTCLKRMRIEGGPASALLNHLLIPVGTRLAIEVDLSNHSIGGRPPKFFDNLRNLPNFTKVRLTSDGRRSRMRLTGLNGSVLMSRMSSRVDEIHFSLESLAQFDTSDIERLDISFCDFPSNISPHKVFLPMKNLCALSLNLCKNPRVFIHALDPGMNPSRVVACPKLEELALDIGDHDLTDAIVSMASGRVLRGAKLRTFRIVGRRSSRGLSQAGLGKHVSQLEYCGMFPRVDDEEY